MYQRYKVHIAPIAKPIAKDMIIKYHYSHAWTMCRYALGVYYKTDTIDVLGNPYQLIGCIVLYMGIRWVGQQ
jgi:hypothetical protein